MLGGNCVVFIAWLCVPFVISIHTSTFIHRKARYVLENNVYFRISSIRIGISSLQPSILTKACSLPMPHQFLHLSFYISEMLITIPCSIGHSEA